MGEEQSQNPEQQGEQPRYDSEQKPEQDEVVQSNAEGEQATEMTEPNSVDQNDDPDTRWDHDKAETMAAVLKEDGTFDDKIEQRDEKKQDVLDQGTSYKNYKKDMHEFMASNDGATNEDINTAREEYEGAEEAAHRQEKLVIEKWKPKVDKVVDEVLSPYQELYDMNPAVFAEMPTKEFMVVAKELAEISRKIKENEPYSEKIEWYNRQIKDAFEKKRIVNWNIIDALEQEIGMNLEMDDDTYDEMLKKFKAEVSDSFDKTPRQIMEGYMRVGGEYTSRFEAKKLADEQRKKDFLDKYKPETSDQDQN